MSKNKQVWSENDDGCGAKQPDKIKLEGMDGITAVWKKLDDVL